MTMSVKNADKRAQFNRLLHEGEMVSIVLDSRCQGVVVPEYCVANRLHLQIGLNMVVPIPDLKVTREHIRCTLSFRRMGFTCVLPWEAVYYIESHDGSTRVQWNCSIPSGVNMASDARPASPKPKRKVKIPPYLRVIEGGKK
jgi:hypothetical protein